MTKQESIGHVRVLSGSNHETGHSSEEILSSHPCAI